MINHVRTLLMNRSREGAVLTDPGEEHVPREFQPRELPHSLRRMYVALFGNVGDRIFVNYRMRQIMGLMHATELSGDIRYHDNRITYLPHDDDLFAAKREPIVTHLAGTPATYHVYGDHTADTQAGISSMTWNVTLMENNMVAVTTQYTPTPVITELTYQGNMASSLELPGSGLLLRMQSAEPGYRLRIRSVAYPRSDTAYILYLLENYLTGEVVHEIFPRKMPTYVAQWREIWANHPLLPYRVTAALLALAERIEQLPQEVANA